MDSTSRPSLYLACRIVSLVQRFSHRLGQRVRVHKRNKNKNPFAGTGRESLRLRATSDIERIAVRRRGSGQPRFAVENGHQIDNLLQELEGHRQRQQVPLVEVASHEELFLRHGNTLAEELLPCSKASLAQVAYLFDLSTLLIGRLESLAQGGSVAASVPCGLPGDAKATANLTHLLLRLQYQLFRLLVNHGVQRIEAVAGRWREFWQQQRRLGDNWFAEWPDGRRPLSTTWPWNNIRPSLLVLWGVCWMFYDAYGDDDLVRSSEGFWSRQGGQYLDGAVAGGMPAPGSEAATAYRYEATNGGGEAAAPSVAPPGLHHLHGLHQASQHLHPPQQIDLRIQTSVSPGVYNTPAAAPAAVPFDPPDQRWDPRPSGGDAANLPLVDALQPGYIGTPLPDLSPVPPYPPVCGIANASAFRVHHTSRPLQQQITQHLLYTPQASSQWGLNRDMGDGTDYPSPRSEGPGGPPSVLVSAPEAISPTPKMTEQASPGLVDGTRPRLSVRRARDPPKNAAGQIYCDHPDCQANPPTFRRPCEWNKHMDKHDRPYKCMEPGCDKIQGFTYSGGLLRHQREVHKKNANSKKPLMCPYPDCNRSTGNGFTRQENLKEHLRRRHMHTENGTSPELPTVQTADVDGMRAASLSQVPAVKRKRDSADTSAAIQDEENGIDLRSELKRLRREVQEKDRRLEELERIVAGLQQAMPQAATTQG